MLLHMAFSSVQRLSSIQLFETPWTAALQASLSITNFWSLLKLMSITLVMPSIHLILCRPLLLPPSIFPSIRVFSSGSVLGISMILCREEKHWGFPKGLSVKWNLGRVREIGKQEGQLGGFCSDLSKLLPSSLIEDLL